MADTNTSKAFGPLVDTGDRKAYVENIKEKLKSKEKLNITKVEPAPTPEQPPYSMEQYLSYTGDKKEYMENWKAWTKEQNDKNAVNYNISTEFEGDEKSLTQKLSDLGDAIVQFLTPHSDKLIKSAQQDQIRIDQLTDEYYNGNLGDEQKKQTLSEIQTLEKNRDKKLNYGQNNRFQRTFVIDSSDEDVYRALRDPNSQSDEDFQEMAGRSDASLANKKTTKEHTSLEEKINMLKKVTKTDQEEQINSLVDEYKKAVKKGEAKADETGQGFLEWYSNKIGKGYGVQGYMLQFRNDVLGSIEPQNITLTGTEGEERHFFKDEAAEFVTNLIMLDDIYKPIVSNYNVVAKVEKWMNSENESEREYAKSPYVQYMYTTAVKNLNNLKDETAFLYENFGKYNGDIREIENAYAKEKGRKMFSNANEKYEGSLIDEFGEQTSEDWGTRASLILNRDAHDYIEKEYPNLGQKARGNVVEVGSYFFDWGSFFINSATAGLTEIERDASEFTNTFYNFLQDESSWADFDYIWQLDLGKVQESWERNKEYVENTTREMSSLQSLKDKLLDENNGWNNIVNKIRWTSDASPVLLKEIGMFKVSEGLLDSLGLASTSEMIAETSQGSQRWAKVVAWNKGLLELDTSAIVQAKIWEFVGRGIIQNALLSASANSNFSEDYSDLDFGLDLGFAFIEIFTMGYGMTIGKGKITEEALKGQQRNALRQAMKIKFGFTDDQWAKLMLADPKKVDEVAAELWKKAVNAINTMAAVRGVDPEEIVREMRKAAEMKNETTRMVTQGYKSNQFWTKVILEEKWIQALSEGYRAMMVSAFAQVVHSKPGRYSKSIVDKLWIETETIGGKDVVTHIGWKEEPTYEEMLEIIRKSNTPALSKLWDKIEKYFKRGEAVDVETKNKSKKEKTEDIKNTDKSTAEGQVKSSAETTSMDTDYENLLKSNLAGGVEQTERYRRWEYEKYGRPNGYEIGDIGYTVYGVAKNNDEILRELYKRIREFAKDYDTFFKVNSEEVVTEYNNIKDWNTLNEGNIKLSESITGKKNIVGLTYEQAKEINPNLNNTTQTFFNEVSNTGRLELYQKNAILRSVLGEGKDISADGTSTILKLKKGENKIFGSSFEEDHTIGKFGSIGNVGIRFPNGEIKPGKYIRYKDNIVIKGDGFEYKLGIKNGTITSNVEMDVGFDPPKEFRYSHDLKFYHDGKVFDKKLKEFEEKNSNEMTAIETIQKIEDILSRGWHKNDLGDIKTRNRYQSEDHDYTFQNRQILLTAQQQSGYLNIIDIFDVPFSYFVEVLKDLAIGRLPNLNAGAIKLLGGSWSNVLENSDYFIISEDSIIYEQTLRFLFHQAGIILLPTGEVKYGGFKPYIYEREEGTLGFYNIYSSDDPNRPIMRMAINTDTGKTFLQDIKTRKTEQLTDYRINKHEQIDINTNMFDPRNDETYKKERNMLFDHLKNKEQAGVYNTYAPNEGFDVTNDKDVALKFRMISYRGGGRNYSSDLKVDPKNKNIIKNLYNFKNLSLRLSRESRDKVTTMFNDWINSIKLEFYKDKLGSRTIEEGENSVKNMKLKGIDFEEDKVFGTFKNDATAVIIDTEPMGFTMNYLLKSEREQINTLGFKVKDGNKSRIMSIGNMPTLKTEMVGGVNYLHIAEKSGINYFFKLDPTVGQQPRYKINPLGLIRRDYEGFIEAPKLYEESIAGDRLYDFILFNLDSFPEEVTEMVIDGASATDVYTFMKSYAANNDMMKGIIEVWGSLDFNPQTLEGTITLEELFLVYNEALKLQRIINKLNSEGIYIGSDFFKYYKYITGANKIVNEAYMILFDLGLGVFVSDVTESILLDRYRNIYSNKGSDNISKSYYSLAQFEIIRYRIGKFIERYNNYDSGLDLKTVDGMAEYIKRVKNGYLLAIQVIDKDKIRDEFNLMLKSNLINANNFKILKTTNLVLMVDYYTKLIQIFGKAIGILDEGISKGKIEKGTGIYSDILKLVITDDFQDSIYANNKVTDVIFNISEETLAKEFIYMLLGEFAPKDAVSLLNNYQNGFSESLKIAIKNLNEKLAEADKYNENEFETDEDGNYDVKNQMDKDVKDTVDNSADVKESDKNNLQTKANELAIKANGGKDVSKETKSYIKEKDSIMQNSLKKSGEKISKAIIEIINAENNSVKALPYYQNTTQNTETAVNNKLEITEDSIKKEALSNAKLNKDYQDLERDLESLKQILKEDQRLFEEGKNNTNIIQEDLEKLQDLIDETQGYIQDTKESMDEIVLNEFNKLKNGKYKDYNIKTEPTKQEPKAEEPKVEENKTEKQDTKKIDLNKDKLESNKIDTENEMIQEKNNETEQMNSIYGNYTPLKSLKTKNIMGFSTIGNEFEVSINDMLGGEQFLQLIDELSKTEGWKMPKSNVFLREIKMPIMHQLWLKILNNDVNIGLFLKSEEGMEYMLYSLFYHLCVPNNFIDTFNTIFGTELKYDMDFKTGFNIVYNTYKDYFGLPIEVQKGGMININRGNGYQQRTFFYHMSNMKDISQIKDMLKNIEVGLSGRKAPAYYKYDTRKIYDQEGNKRFINRYNRFLDDSIKGGAMETFKYKSGPLTVYEYWTLEKVDKIVKQKFNRSVFEFIFSKGRYISPSYGRAVKGDNFTMGYNEYYRLLTDEANIKEFKQLGNYTDNELYSLYTKGKLNEIELGGFKVDGEGGILYRKDGKKDYLKLNNTSVMSSNYFLDKGKDSLGSLFDEGKEMIIVKGGNIDEIKKALKGNKKIEYQVNNHLDEIEIVRKYSKPQDKKAVDKVVDKTVEDSFRVTCK